MKYRILHRSGQRVHLDLARRRLTGQEADVLYYTLIEREDVESVQVFARTGELILRYRGQAEKDLLECVGQMDLQDPDLIDKLPSVSARATNEFYKEKIADKIILRLVKQLLVPAPVRIVWTVADGLPYIIRGIRDIFRRNFTAEIVHASAILASLLTQDFSTASSIIFLTDVGEILEEWTYKKSVDDLAQSLALNISRVWKVEGDSSVLVGINQIQDGDLVQVSVGSMIPLDGVVTEGEALVNQAALTGESIPVEKREDSSVFAGTVVEEGELIIQVKGVSGETRYDRIVHMIEDSESMTSVTQSRAEKVVSRLIPYTFGTALLTGLLTRSITKAASVLMVDFSCAIEVAMPIAILSAMREAGRHQITVKGGKYLEMISEADTVVFDKTGTLTYATPVVEEIVTMDGRDESDMLALAACLEEHFPHSLANAVVKAARDRKISHAEIHTKPTYIVAHGIVSSLNGERVVIGSYHFVLEDEGAFLSEEDRERVRSMPPQYSRLYMAVGGRMAAVIGIADPIKKETAEIISRLRETGIRHIVMMTGDSERTAEAIAREAGISEFYAEVLPEDKAGFVQKERDKGRKVIMIGDGINDSPALSAADVGIAMKEGADIAREIADITLSGKDLEGLLTLRKMSEQLMIRMNRTARVGISFNAAILVAGIAGAVVPGTAAFLHNASTIGLCLHNMTDLLEDPEEIGQIPVRAGVAETGVPA